jgi:hypothetical protein
MVAAEQHRRLRDRVDDEAEILRRHVVADGASVLRARPIAGRR